MVSGPTDPSEFRELYEKYYGFVWHTLHRFGLQHVALEDALQDAFVVAYRKRDDFSQGSAKAWLYGISRRVAANYRRAERRHGMRVDALAHVAAELRSPVPEAILALDRYLGELDVDDRELFVLSEIEGLTGPEISTAVGRNVNTIYMRLRMLRAGLRDRAIAPGVRRAQPRGSERGWALLLPALKPVTVVVSSAVGSGWIIAAVAAGLGAGALAVPRALEAETARPLRSLPLGTSLAERAVSDKPSDQGPLDVGIGAWEQPVSVPTEAAPTPLKSGKTRLRANTELPGTPVAAVDTEDSEPARSSKSTLSIETELIWRSRRALQQGDAAAALQMVDSYAERFPRGALEDPAAVIRVEALCLLGRLQKARAQARALLARSPAITARRRLDNTCIAEPVVVSSAPRRMVGSE